MENEIIRLIIGLFGAFFGMRIMLNTLSKHKRIDTESVAIVSSIQDLGRSGVKKVYAITYDIKSSEPFELLVAPCKKAPKIGKTSTIYYEKSDPKANYYFKSIGTFDHRFFGPAFLMFSGIVMIIVAVLSVVGIC